MEGVEGVEPDSSRSWVYVEEGGFGIAAHVRDALATSLITKVRDGDLEKVRRHLAATNADVNEVDSDGRTALHWLASSRWTHAVPEGQGAEVEPGCAGAPDRNTARLALAKLLVEASIDLNLQDANGEAALHVAAVDTGDSAFVEFLVNAGADVNIKNLHGQTPLHLAAVDGTATTTTLLLKHGALVNAADAAGQTPLHLAIRAQRAETAEALLASGANRNAKNAKNETPLHVAAQLDSDQGIVLLLREGASSSSIDTQGRSPLLVAAETGNLASLKALPFMEGFKMRDDRGWTPLHAASANGHLHIVEHLIGTLAAGARSTMGMFGANAADLDSEDALGNTPLHLALYHGHVDVARSLAFRGATVDAKAQFFEATLNHRLTTETTGSLLTLSHVMTVLSTWLPFAVAVMLVSYGGLIYLLFSLQHVIGSLARRPAT